VALFEADRVGNRVTASSRLWSSMAREAISAASASAMKFSFPCADPALRPAFSSRATSSSVRMLAMV
jgi:hypothetical protein